MHAISMFAQHTVYTAVVSTTVINCGCKPRLCAQSQMIFYLKVTLHTRFKQAVGGY